MLRYTLLSLDIIQISKMDFERISFKSWWHFVVASPSQKKDITDFWGLRKALISWRYPKQKAGPFADPALNR